MTMTARQYWEAGQLTEAIAAATDDVKRRPTDTAARGFLCGLFCFTGDLERADKHLDTIMHQEPEAVMGIATARHLVRAEKARQEFYASGALPEFLDQPTPTLRLHLDASIRVREGNLLEAAELLAQAEAERPRVAGVCDGKPFDDLRDLDDLTASFVEVLTSTGKYYWIPMERLESIEFRPPKHWQDLIWRSAHMIVRDGPDGEVYLPVLYAGSSAVNDNQIRLGRATDWQGGDGSPVRGLGQRSWLVGDEDRPFIQIGEMTFGEGE